MRAIGISNTYKKRTILITGHEGQEKRLSTNFEHTFSSNILWTSQEEKKKSVRMRYEVTDQPLLTLLKKKPIDSNKRNTQSTSRCSRWPLVMMVSCLHSFSDIVHSKQWSTKSIWRRLCWSGSRWRWQRETAQCYIK